MMLAGGWRWRALLPVAGFVALFALLQSLWQWAQGGWFEHLWVDTLTVRASAAIVNAITPDVGAAASGARIVAPGGGLNILNGCDGTDMLFLLLAAFVVAPLSFRAKLAGVLAGIVFVFVLNLARIVALFYAFRADRGLFDLLHTMVGPVVLVAAAGLFFHLWLQRARTPPATPST